ncbi:hypothetical protein GCM10020000_86680 [Streptomyces olivoverticillatus]
MVKTSAAWMFAERAYAVGRVLVCVLLPAYLLSHLTSCFMWAWWVVMVVWMVVSGRVIKRKGWLDGWEREEPEEDRFTGEEDGGTVLCAEPAPQSDHEKVAGGAAPGRGCSFRRVCRAQRCRCRRTGA